MRIKTFILLLIVIVGFSTENVQSGEYAQQSAVKRFSIEVKGQVFKEILVELEKKSGVLVTIDEELGNVKITGDFSDVTLEEFLHRALKEQNIALEFGKNGSIVTVQSFKMASNVGKLVGKGSTKEMQAEQLVALAERQKNPDAIDPTTGVPRGVLKKMQEKQLVDFAEWQNNPDSKDPMTGLRKGDLQVIQEKQLTAFAEWQDNLDAKVPRTDVRRGELKEMQASQLAGFDRWRNDPNSKDPMTGLPRGELKKMQERQLAEFADRGK